MFSKPRRGDRRVELVSLSPLQGFVCKWLESLGLTPQALCDRHFVAKKRNFKTDASGYLSARILNATTTTPARVAGLPGYVSGSSRG